LSWITLVSGKFIQKSLTCGMNKDVNQSNQQVRRLTLTIIPPKPWQWLLRNCR
jgi:hypothetical protein